MRTAVERGDIVLVDLEWNKGSEKGNDAKGNPRPCIVVQAAAGNAVSSLTIIVPSSTVSDRLDVPGNVDVTAAELGPGGRDSTIECGQVRAIDGDARVSRKLGHIDADALKRIDQGLADVLNLTLA